MPQELAVYGELSARENLSFFGELYGLAGPLLSERTDHVLAAMGLSDRADDRVDTFSGGMKRRLNLGAAFVHSPAACAARRADHRRRSAIAQPHLRGGPVGSTRDGVTIVYTSHYMEEVQALCRRIGIIDHGRLIACDTLPALLQRLKGLIRFQISETKPASVERLAALPDADVKAESNNRFALECRDVTGTLLRLIALLKDLEIELTSIEISEPDLERVFLYLTGKTLRD